jgi:hypothetical protein
MHIRFRTRDALTRRSTNCVTTRGRLRLTFIAVIQGQLFSMVLPKPKLARLMRHPLCIYQKIGINRHYSLRPSSTR